jgi:hypothetical protein
MLKSIDGFGNMMGLVTPTVALRENVPRLPIHTTCPVVTKVPAVVQVLAVHAPENVTVPLPSMVATSPVVAVILIAGGVVAASANGAKGKSSKARRSTRIVRPGTVRVPFVVSKVRL